LLWALRGHVGLRAGHHGLEDLAQGFLARVRGLRVLQAQILNVVLGLLLLRSQLPGVDRR
jgi:hypothetical protein